MENGSQNSYPTVTTGKSPLLAQARSPYPGLGAITPARIGITAGISGTAIFVAPSDLLNRLQLSGRAEEPTTTSQIKGGTEARHCTREDEGVG
jgi:hypothetical protein